MALFVISWTDRPGSLDLRMASREAHLAYAATFGERIRIGGPFLDADGQMAGSMMIVEFDSLEEAQAFHAADPYKLAGLFDRSEVRPWRMTVGSGLPAKS
jgi:uncharacterized protein YciI